MSANVVQFRRDTGDFQFDSAPVTREQLLEMRDRALTGPRRKRTVRSSGGCRRRVAEPNLVQVGSVAVTANYIDLMLGWVDKHGWFIDYLINHEDHRFDPNAPTPGSSWNRIRTLRKEAGALNRAAFDLGKRGLNGESEQLKQSARTKLDEARRLEEETHARMTA